MALRLRGTDGEHHMLSPRASSIADTETTSDFPLAGVTQQQEIMDDMDFQVCETMVNFMTRGVPIPPDQQAYIREHHPDLKRLNASFLALTSYPGGYRTLSPEETLHWMYTQGVDQPLFWALRKKLEEQGILRMLEEGEAVS